MKFPEPWNGCDLLLKDLNKEGVEYLMVGSMAESHYRSLARVGDMDVLINSTPENATKVKPALDSVVWRIYGSPSRCTAEDLAEPGKHHTSADRVWGVDAIIWKEIVLYQAP